MEKKLEPKEKFLQFFQDITNNTKFKNFVCEERRARSQLPDYLGGLIDDIFIRSNPKAAEDAVANAVVQMTKKIENISAILDTVPMQQIEERCGDELEQGGGMKDTDIQELRQLLYYQITGDVSEEEKKDNETARKFFITNLREYNSSTIIYKRRSVPPIARCLPRRRLLPASGECLSTLPVFSLTQPSRPIC